MPNGQCVIIGAGSVGLQLIQLLSRDLELVCVDRSETALAAARELRSDGLLTVAGDATSRLVLEEAGVDGAEIVVITTTSEKINIEVARVLKDHFHPRRVLGLGITPKGIAALEQFEMEVVEIFALAATGLRNRLEHKTKAVQGIGLGRNEILEVEVHPHSRLANKPLAALNPKSWRAGIIYREGNIIIPTGDTVMRPKDRVILLGDPRVLKTVTDLLTFRFTHFPREYGDTLVAWFGGREPERYLDEVAYLLSVFPLDRAFFVLAGQLPEIEEKLRQMAEKLRLKELDFEYEQNPSPLSALRRTLAKKVRRTSLVVLPHTTAPPATFTLGAGSLKQELRQLLRLVGCPMLLAAGTFPYERVAVPCVEPEGLQHAMETTLEMSSAINYEIDALFVRLSPYIATGKEIESFPEMRKTISDLGLIYKTAIGMVELEGNPVQAVTAAMSERNLLVMDVGSWRNDRFFTSLVHPDPAWEIVRRAPVSRLLIPPMEIIA